MPTYRTASVDGLKLFYREAGDPKAPTVLLLQGFPMLSTSKTLLARSKRPMAGSLQQEAVGAGSQST